MPVYRVRGPDGAIHRVEGPENADPSVITALVAQNVGSPDVGPQRKYGFGETLSQGAERGFRRLGSTFGDIIPAMGASALGFDDYAKAQLEEAAQSEADIASEIPAEFQSYKDVEGIGDALKFATQVGSEQLANLATAIVPGVGLGGLAVRGAVGTAAQIAAKKAAGQLLGAYLGSYALNAPEVFQNVYQETGELAPGAAALFSTVSAALDSFLPASLMRTVPAPLKAGIVERLLARSGMDKGLLRSVTSNVLKNTAGESVTEAAQEGISIAAERFINDNPELFGEAEWDRIMESAVQGGVGGGVFGIAGGGAERASEGAQDRQRLFDIREQRAARDAATRSRGEEAAREKEIAEYQQAGPQLGLPGIEPMPYASSLVTPTPNVEEPKVRGKAPAQTEMFTPQGTLTPPAEKMEAKDTKRVAAQAKQAEIVARQAAQQQAAAEKAAKKQGVADLTAPVDLLASSRPPLEQVLGVTGVGKEESNVNKIATAQTRLQAAALENKAIDAAAGPLSVLPSNKADLLQLFPGATPALGIFKENGPLWGRDLSDPNVAAQVKTDLETVGQKYSGKNLNAVETFLARPEFQAIPAPTTVVNPTPTTTSQEDASGKIETVKAKTQKPELGQETSQTGNIDTPIATPPAITGKKLKPPVKRGASLSPELEVEQQQRVASKYATAAKEYNALIPQRDEAVKNKNQKEADRIRNAMDDLSIVMANLNKEVATSVKPVTKPVAKPAVKPVIKPVVEPVPESVAGPAVKRVVKPATKPVPSKVPELSFIKKRNTPPTQDVVTETGVELDTENYTPAVLTPAEQVLKAEAVKRGDAEIKAAKADTAVGGSTLSKEKADIVAALPAQKQAYTEAGGKTKYLRKSGPEQARQIVKGPKYQGKSFDATMRALVEKGNIDAVLDAIIKTAKPEIAQILRKVKSLKLKTKIVIGEAQSGLGLLMSQKPQKYKATGGEAAYIAAADGGKWINFQGLNTLDSVRQAAGQDFKTQANSKPVFKDARPYVNGVLNNPAMRGNQQLEALRAQYGDNPARLASDLEGRLVQDHTQAIRAAASLLLAEHKDSPMFMSLVMRMVLADQGATQVATPMPLLRDALADLRTQWETGNIRGVKAARTAYDAAAVLHAEAALKLNPNNIKGLEGGEWVELPRGKTPEVFAFWRSMSNANWCTSRGQEQYYAPRGSMYVYRKDGASRMAILFQNGEVDQIQSEDNDGTIPAEYLAEVKNFTAKAKLSPNAKRTLESAEKATLLLSKLMALAAPGATFDENGFIELADGTFGVRGDYGFDVNESLDDSEYLARQKANGSFGRTVSYVSGNVVIRKGAQVNALTTVGGDAYIYDGAQANALTTVGGDAFLYGGAQANALTTVGGDATIHDGAQANALTTVGGDATIYAGAQANALTTVGGDAYIYDGAQANALTTVGGDAFIRTGAQANALTTVGGDATIHESVIRSPGLRTNVGQREALRGTPLEVLNSSDFSGSYNPATDTITLDPESGLNEHIFIHEVLHAALSKVFASPNLKITKDMQKFFMQIKDRMGDSYGGSTLDEFASELVSNPEFQALLKTIKAPRSGSLWDRIMQAIAEFFGFSKGQSAYTAGLNFVSDALDIAEGVEANPIDKLFYGPGKLNDLKSAVSSAAKGTKTQLRDAISSEKDLGFKVKILGAVSLNDMETMFGTELPIKQLETAVETKSGAVDKGIEQVSKNIKKIAVVERKYPKIIISMNKMAIDARRAGIDLINPTFTPSATQQAEYTRLKNIYNNVLNKEVREVYGLIRKDLDGFLKQFTDYISAVLPNAAATKLLKKFANLHGVTGYVPFLRHGEFWVEYTDPVTGERTPMGRESPAAVEEVVAAVRKQHPQMRDDDFKRYVNIQSLKAPKDMPTASFISDLIAELRANNIDADIVDSVYQQYHSMFPANSIMQQFNKAKMLPGMDEDIVRSYADVAVKWVHKLANMEHNPKILEALVAVKQAASKDGKYGADMNIQAVAKSINAQQESFLNLTYSPLARGLTTGSYYLHILGSVASAAINLSGLMFFVYPILGGRFGFPATLTAMLDAGKLAIGSWGTGKYKALYESLDARGLLKHTIAREALERGKTSGKDFSGLIDKVIELLSIPFSASERYMRGATAIAAYELALKGGSNQKAMSPAEAIEFAAKTVKDTHTAGMSEVSPAYFKNDFGRVILTFKKIAFQQTFVIARAFHQALVASDIPPEAKKIARQQLLGIFGMSGAFLGAAGLPLYGMFSTLARMLEALIPDDDDEPYDPNMQLRGLTGDFLYEGLIAKLFNIEVSKRAALANDILFRDDPQSVKDMGYVKTVLFNLAGPMGGYAANTERALGDIANGNIERGLETMLPTFVANGMKGIRYMANGAETLDGEPIDEDVNAWNGFMQMFGFAPADLAETQEMRSAAKNYENKILARKQKILDRYNMAYAAGDMDMVREARDDARAFRRSYPKLMASDTLERSRRGREAAAEDMIRGLRFTKSLRPDIEQRFNLGPE